MSRLDQEKQKRLEPNRKNYAKHEITALGYTITVETDKELHFDFEGHDVAFWPYSGWHSGKSIKDGRGLQKLLDQIKP